MVGIQIRCKDLGLSPLYLLSGNGHIRRPAEWTHYLESSAFHLQLKATARLRSDIEDFISERASR